MIQEALGEETECTELLQTAAFTTSVGEKRQNLIKQCEIGQERLGDHSLCRRLAH